MALSVVGSDNGAWNGLPSIPAGTQEGDLILLQLGSGTSGGTSFTVSNYSTLAFQFLATQRTQGIYKRVATGSGDAPSVSTPSGDWISNLTVIRGADPDTIVVGDYIGWGGPSGAMPIPAVASSDTGWLIQFVFIDDDYYSMTWTPSGTTLNSFGTNIARNTCVFIGQRVFTGADDGITYANWFGSDAAIGRQILIKEQYVETWHTGSIKGFS